MECAAADEGDEHDDVGVLEGVDALKVDGLVMRGPTIIVKIISKTKVQGDHSPCAKPPVDFKTKVRFWPVQARTGQAKAEL